MQMLPVSRTLALALRGQALRVPRIHLATGTSAGSLYRVFGLNPNCTHEELKETFYRLCKLYHPDVTDDPRAHSKFQEISKAYEILGNPMRRSDYDRGLRRPIRSSAGSSGSFYGDLDAQAVRSPGEDTFSDFYVKQYNRILNENWFRKSDPELIKSTIEFKQEERNFAATVLFTLLYGTILGYAYTKWKEEPIKLNTDVELGQDIKH
ncbi:unnamed protein product [Calicophoron daubneyi]|uniref:J domain-containing protein n=1 Tax=Calicophoron daubneyi TaxID=300641 RepID=A0AAV2TLC1_CALDB